MHTVHGTVKAVPLQRNVRKNRLRLSLTAGIEIRREFGSAERPHNKAVPGSSVADAQPADIEIYWKTWSTPAAAEDICSALR